MRIISDLDSADAENYIPNGEIFRDLISSMELNSNDFEIGPLKSSIPENYKTIDESIFFVVKGEVVLSKLGIDLAVFEKGDLIGCFEEFRRSCYIKSAKENGAILKIIDKKAFEKKLEELKSIKLHRYVCDLVAKKIYSIEDLLSLSEGGLSSSIHLVFEKYQKDQVIIKRGENIRKVYYLLNGKVRVEEKDKKITTLDEGEFFGYYNVLIKEAPIADVVADTDVVLISIKDFEFLNLIGINRFITKKIMNELINHIKILNLQKAEAGS